MPEHYPSMNTARSTRRRGRPRSAESERAILDATMQLLASGGFAALTLDRVAARARASKSTIYRRWPTKEHLMIAVASRWPALEARDRGDVLAELRDLHRQLLRTLHSPRVRGLLTVLVAERIRNPALAAALDPLLRARRDPVRMVLARAVERGELPQDADIDAGAEALVSVTTTRLHHPRTDIGLRTMTPIFRLILRGLGAKGRPVPLKAKRRR